jgi:O-antigen biosynthesis protein WbqP
MVSAQAGGHSVEAVIGGDSSGYTRVKRVLDFAIAVLLFSASLPLWPIVALLICLDSPGPMLFRQARAGRGGVPFTLYKFRTMRTGTPNIATRDLACGAGPSPITKTGVLLRRTSLDEIPQLINVLRGEMSLVGPRPALLTQTTLLALRRATGADAVLPGITGWAQINGRDNLDDTAKAAFDADYVKLRSLRFDLRILAQTLAPVVSGHGNR